MLDGSLQLSPFNLLKILAAGIVGMQGGHHKGVLKMCTNVLRLLGQAELAASIAYALSACDVWPGCTPAELRHCAATVAYYAANVCAGAVAAAGEDHRKPAADAEQAVGLARQLVALAPATPHYLLACAYQDHDDAGQGEALRDTLRLAEASNCARRAPCLWAAAPALLACRAGL